MSMLLFHLFDHNLDVISKGSWHWEQVGSGRKSVSRRVEAHFTAARYSRLLHMSTDNQWKTGNAGKRENLAPEPIGIEWDLMEVDKNWAGLCWKILSRVRNPQTSAAGKEVSGAGKVLHVMIIYH